MRTVDQLEGGVISGIQRRDHDIRQGQRSPNLPVAQQRAVGQHGKGKIGQCADAFDQLSDYRKQGTCQIVSGRQK